MLLPLCGPSWWICTSVPGVGDRQAPQHHLIDQREDRGRRADAEGEREDGDDGEQGAATEPADGIAEIA